MYTARFMSEQWANLHVTLSAPVATGGCHATMAACRDAGAAVPRGAESSSIFGLEDDNMEDFLQLDLQSLLADVTPVSAIAAVAMTSHLLDAELLRQRSTEALAAGPQSSQYLPNTKAALPVPALPLQSAAAAVAPVQMHHAPAPAAVMAAQATPLPAMAMTPTPTTTTTTTTAPAAAPSSDEVEAEDDLENGFALGNLDQADDDDCGSSSDEDDDLDGGSSSDEDDEYRRQQQRRRRGAAPKARANRLAAATSVVRAASASAPAPARASSASSASSTSAPVRRVPQDDENGDFPCKKCTRVFTKADSLRKHCYREHSGLSPVTCNHGNCGRKFKSATEMRSHYLRRHSPDKPFLCPFCERRYAIAGALHAHLRRSHPRDMVPCSHCDRSFASQGDLRKHLVIKHKLNS